LPLPATLDAAGCGTRSKYVGNTLTDVPKRIYSQDDRGFIEADVREVAAAGLTGFAVNWAGTGQSVTSNPYSKRLQMMVDAVHKVNAQGIPFKLWLSYKASAVVLSQARITNDLKYFVAKYGRDPAFDRLRSAKPTVMWQGSRKYSVAALQNVSRLYRSKLRVLGDETVWSNARAPYLDGDAYYWSSQNPYRNQQSFSQLAALAASGRNPRYGGAGSERLAGTAWLTSGGRLSRRSESASVRPPFRPPVRPYGPAAAAPRPNE
jgi:hypothetical protein